MTQRLWWSFGDPREEGNQLVTDFYYKTGKHMRLTLPWPARRFTAAGELPIQVNGGDDRGEWIEDFSTGSVETGRRLYSLLGKEAQETLIRSFANLPPEVTNRVLYLQFPPPSPENRELCLAMEDLPWELLHDGNDFISWRYSLQIVRSHSRDFYPIQSSQNPITSWGILLLRPFIQAGEKHCRNVGLEPLKQGVEEVNALRRLEEQTHGLVRIGPRGETGKDAGIRTFDELESILFSSHGEPYHMIHYVGHGVVYDDDPCLCFENGSGAIDYVSVERLQRLFLAVRDARPNRLPKLFFLNACSSSSRGRYSAGFASGLHDLGMCVLGYNTEIRDDEMPILAAQSFYQSLCVDQSLQNPNQNPNVLTSIGSARRRLRSHVNEAAPLWGSLRVYLPSEISFRVHGRGVVERTLQKMYTHYAQWMNPDDYTDHLSIGILFAIFFGGLMGLANLLFISPELVLSRHLTYQEIVSELTRIFLVGPISFLAASIFTAFQTQMNHRFLLPIAGRAPLGKRLRHIFWSIPSIAAAGAAFGLLFSYSFARLDLLTTQTKSLVFLTGIPVSVFWYSLVGILGVALSLSLFLASWIGSYHRETLHSYRTFYVLLIFLGVMLLGDLFFIGRSNGAYGRYRFAGWILYAALDIFAYSLACAKFLKETSWRASQKSAGVTSLSWRKLLPLLGGVFLVGVCYYLLEVSVRFENYTIRTALVERKEAIERGEDNPLAERILERALRQRAISELPDREAAQEDWLLSIVAADYKLYAAKHEVDPDKRLRALEQCLDFLTISKNLNPEVEYKDYYYNILAMFDVLSADLSDIPSTKKKKYEEAVEMARKAVDKDDKNFAYLDTLARALSKLAVFQNDTAMLDAAETYTREAEWCAFFLRSPSAGEVKKSIAEVADYINKQKKSLKDE